MQQSRPPNVHLPNARACDAEQYRPALRCAFCPPSPLSLFGEWAGGEVGLSGTLSGCPAGFSLTACPNLYFPSGRPIFHRLANSTCSSSPHSGSNTDSYERHFIDPLNPSFPFSHASGEKGMKDRALVVAPLPACVGEGRDEVRGEGWNGLHSIHTPCSRNCRDMNAFPRGGQGVRLRH